MVNEWCEELLRCAEGLYVLEEESKKIVWVNPYLTDGLNASCRHICKDPDCSEYREL